MHKDKKWEGGRSSRAPNNSKDERMDMRNIMKDIELLGHSHMTWKEKKALENKMVVSLGGKAESESSRQSTSKSSQNEMVKEWHDAWEQGDNQQVEIEGLDECGAFWMKLKSAAERKVGATEAERFCKTFQCVHSKLVNEELSSDVARNINKLWLDSHK